MSYEYVDQNRDGDHICYISDLAKMKAHYPGWGITKSVHDTMAEIARRTGRCGPCDDVCCRILELLIAKS